MHSNETGDNLRTTSGAKNSRSTIYSPNHQFTVVLKPEYQGFDDSSESSCFRAADWIYAHEKACVLEEERLRTETADSPRPKPTPRATVRLPTPYLVNREASDPAGRKRLISAIWQNPKAFYYYKQRHLFRPYKNRIRTKSQLQSEKTGQGTHVTFADLKPRPNTSISKVETKLSPSPPIRPLTSAVDTKKHRKNVQSEWSGDFLSTLLTKCNDVQTNPKLAPRMSQDLKFLKLFHKRLDQTQDMMTQISDCEPDLMIPFYLYQREALEDFYKDAKKITSEYRNASIDPSQERAKYERALRRNKNQIL